MVIDNDDGSDDMILRMMVIMLMKIRMIMVMIIWMTQYIIYSYSDD